MLQKHSPNVTKTIKSQNLVILFRNFWKCCDRILPFILFYFHFGKILHPKQNAMQNRPSTITYKHISALQLHCKNAKFSDWKYIHINIDYQYQLTLNLAIMPLIMKMVQVTIMKDQTKKKGKRILYIEIYFFWDNYTLPSALFTLKFYKHM